MQDEDNRLTERHDLVLIFSTLSESFHCSRECIATAGEKQLQSVTMHLKENIEETILILSTRILFLLELN